MSALPPKADIAELEEDVCFVPKADIGAGTRLSDFYGIRQPEQHHPFTQAAD